MEVIHTMVAENTKRIIKERGLKQNAVAERAGYSPKVFNSLINGKKVMREMDIARIASALDVAPNDLFARSSENRV